MKAVILLIISMILVNSLAYERVWAKGDVLLSELQEGEDVLYIVYFSDSTNTQETYAKVRENQKVMDKLQDYLKTISPGGDDEFPTKVFFASVDATDPTNKNLLSKADIDADILDDGPAIICLRHGKGYIQYGAQVNSALKKSVTALKDNSNEHTYSI